MTDPDIQGADFTAGRIVSARLRLLAGERKSFCFETNLASKGLVGRIDRLAHDGYTTRLIFVSLPTMELALARVAARVMVGGHDVAEATVRRRFTIGLRFFFDTYRPRVDQWSLWENALEEPVRVADSENHFETIYDQPRWDHLWNLASLPKGHRI